MRTPRSPILPPPGPRWRRIAAIGIDVALIMCVSLGLVIVCKDFFYQIGPYGRIISWLMIMSYLTIAHTIFGQTLGKWCLRIAVCDRDGGRIQWTVALARAALVSLPSLFSMWYLPIHSSLPVLWLFSSLLGVGLGGVVVYTVFFNVVKGQGIHDLICNTRVIHLSLTPIEWSFPIQYTHFTVAFVIVFGGFFYGVVSWAKGSVANRVRETPEVQFFRYCGDSSQFYGLHIKQTTIFTPDSAPLAMLGFHCWHKGRINNEDAEIVIDRIAQQAFLYIPEIERFDLVQVKLEMRTDAMISITEGPQVTYNIFQWRQRLGW